MSDDKPSVSAAQTPETRSPVDPYFYPSQCECGHIYLERYEFYKPTAEGFIGFCWCGWCRTKRMVKP